MSIRKLFLCAVLVFFFLLSGCGGGGSDSGGTSSAGCGVLGARIFGGEQCDQDARSPVVALAAVASDGQVAFQAGGCTATLVTLDDLLTSAHCFIEPVIQAQQAGIDIIGFAALVGGRGGQAMAIVDFAIHPLYNGQAGSRYDVAMATIQQVPNPPIGPLPLLLSELTGAGSRITAFGYGTNNEGIDTFLKAADFTVTGIEDGNLIVIGDGSTSVCPGDSGGPAVYIAADGVATLAGVNSFIVNTQGACETVAAPAQGFVDIQNDLILNFIGGYAPDAAVH